MDSMSQFIEMLFKKPITGKIGDLVDKKIFSVKKIHSMNDIIEYIDISSVERSNHSIVETTSYVVSNAPSRAQQCVRLDDILVSTVRPINRNIAVVNSDKNNLVASTGFCVLRPKLAFKEYLLAIVQSDKYTEAMIDKASGGLYPAVNNGDVLNYGIYIPDEEFAKKFSLIYQQADKSKFGDFKSQFIEMTTRSELNKKSIGEIAEVRTGSTPSRSNPEYWNGTHYWVSAQDMGNKYIYDTLEKITDKGYATCKVVPAGSILYVCRGSIGVMSINTMDCATNQSICTATCKKGYNTEYLYYALKVAEKTIKKQGIGTSFKSLNQSAFSSIEILFPAIEIQDKFAAIAKQADKSKSYVRIALKNLESILGYCIRQVA